MDSILAKAQAIRLLIFDVDGVLTDRKITYCDNGTETKSFNAHDGLGIKLLQNSGVAVAIITSRESTIITKRFTELGIKHIYCGQKKKISAYEELLKITELHDEQVAYVGDDLPDLALIRRAGLGIAVADAVAIVKQHADWQTTALGGQGAGREVCDLILQAQGTLQKSIEPYL